MYVFKHLKNGAVSKFLGICSCLSYMVLCIPVMFLKSECNEKCSDLVIERKLIVLLISPGCTSLGWSKI